jgi:hypothetical protein
MYDDIIRIHDSFEGCQLSIYVEAVALPVAVIGANVYFKLILRQQQWYPSHRFALCYRNEIGFNL